MIHQLWPKNFVCKRSVKNSVLTAVFVAGAVASAAHATNYVGTQELNGVDFGGSPVTELISLSFTTDGSVGILAASNFTAYLITGSGGLGAFSIDSAAAAAYSAFADTGFSATPTQLSFDFGDPFAGDIFAGATQQVLFFSGSEAVGPLFEPESGEVVIANAASAVPEPSVWMLVGTGIAMVACALRLRRKHGLIARAVD